MCTEPQGACPRVPGVRCIGTSGAAMYVCVLEYTSDVRVLAVYAQARSTHTQDCVLHAQDCVRGDQTEEQSVV